MHDDVLVGCVYIFCGGVLIGAFIGRALADYHRKRNI